MDESLDTWLDDAELRSDLFKKPADDQVPEGVLALTGHATIWGGIFIWDTEKVTWQISRGIIRRQFAA